MTLIDAILDNLLWEHYKHFIYQQKCRLLSHDKINHPSPSFFISHIRCRHCIVNHMWATTKIHRLPKVDIFPQEILSVNCFLNKAIYFINFLYQCTRFDFQDELNLVGCEQDGSHSCSIKSIGNWLYKDLCTMSKSKVSPIKLFWTNKHYSNVSALIYSIVNTLWL